MGNRSHLELTQDIKYLPCKGKVIGPWDIWLQSQISKFHTNFNNNYLKYYLWIIITDD